MCVEMGNFMNFLEPTAGMFVRACRARTRQRLAATTRFSGKPE
jgi:hypothetical protein